MPKTSTLTATELLLLALDHAGGAVADYWKFFSNPRRYQGAYARIGRGYVAEVKFTRNKATAKQTLDNLRRRQLGRTKQLGGKLMVELTNRGRRRARTLSLQRAAPLPHGTYTMVAFDIPEEVRIARRQFRLFLRQAGFNKLQQSVWISTQDSREALAHFVRELKLERWVMVCTASQFTKPPIYIAQY